MFTKKLDVLNVYDR